MKCAKAKKKISVYLDGELKEDEKQELLTHLEICDDCRKEKEMLSSLLTTFEAPKEMIPPPYVYLKVKQEIEKQETKKFLFFPSIRWLKPITVSLGLMVMLLLSSLAGSFLGKRIWFERTEKSAISQEFKTDLGLVAFDDTPEASFGGIYNDLLEGER